MVKRIGACKEEATVCPGSTLRFRIDAVDRRNDARLEQVRIVELDIGFGNADIGFRACNSSNGSIIRRLGRVDILLR